MSDNINKAFVLLSGGMDSTTLLYYAHNNFDEVEAVSFDYGQKHLKETEYAKTSCAKLGIPFTVLPIHGLSGEGVLLTDNNADIPDISYDDIKGVSPTFVPFRNGTMLAHLTAYAQTWVNEEVARKVDVGFVAEIALDQMKDSATILTGIHAEDAKNWAYPDCTPEFFGAMANAIYIGTYFTIRLQAPLLFLNKKQVVQMGEENAVIWKDTWSCYAGNELHCGTCPTCRSRKDAFAVAGVVDPTLYENDQTAT